MKGILKFIMLSLLLLPLAACGGDEDLWEEWGINETLVPCPVDSVYEGVVDAISPYGVNSVWCTVTKAPIEASLYDNVPNENSNIYFRFENNPETNLECGSTIRFQIIKFGKRPPAYPYLAFGAYYSCIIKPINP